MANVAKTANNECISCLGNIYDILAQGISILDVTTDIIVCIEFYQNDRMTFFGFSLTILLMALVAYIAAFMYKFDAEYRTHRQIGQFFSLILISPFIPFIFYYVDNTDCCLPVLLEDYWCYDLSFNGSDTTNKASRFKQFFEKKVNKHLGFILESLVEAFPQAILQMTSIVIYNEANTIAIISIFISLLSVTSKSFVFSMGSASNFKQLFFNWLSAVTDFFGIFFVVCWVFYQPKDEYLEDAFIMIRQVWLYKLYIFIFPMIGFISIVLHIFGVTLAVYENRTDDCVTIVGILAFFAVTFGIGIAIIASLLVLEITNWTYIAGTFLFLGIKRLPTYSKLSLQYWYSLMKWINSAKKHHIGSKYKGCTSYTKQQDRMMRIASVNLVIAKEDVKKQYIQEDKSLIRYLEKNQMENQCMNITFRGIRNAASKRDTAQFHRKFWIWYAHLWRDEAKNYFKDGVKKCNRLWCERRCPSDKLDWCLDILFGIAISSGTFFFGPIYFISRFLTLLFPGFIVLYLYFGYNVNIWNTDLIDIFQVVMITIYMGLCMILSILFYFNVKEQYLMAHLLPSKQNIKEYISAHDVELEIKKVIDHYNGLTLIPIRNAMIIEQFGPDLGPIIISYLPNDDTFETNHDVLTVKTVV